MQIAENENCNYEDAREITDTIFDFVAKTMKAGDRENYQYENVRVFNFGIFGVKQGRVNYYKKKDQENGT
jgi:nucleoid DNA-binding protein